MVLRVQAIMVGVEDDNYFTCYWWDNSYFIYTKAAPFARTDARIPRIQKPYFYTIRHSAYDCIFRFNRYRNFNTFIHAEHAGLFCNGIWYGHFARCISNGQDVTNYWENI